MDDMRSLVLRAQKRDPQAFGQLVRRFQDMAYGYAYAILGDFHLAQDVLQEAFVEAYRCLPGLRKPDAFPGWLRRIVFKHCDRLLRRRRVPTVPLEAAGSVPAEQLSPAGQAEAQEMRDAVLHAVRLLSEAERAVTTLYYINGYSQKEVAEFLEVPVTTVNDRLHASRKRLKERMFAMVESELRKNALPDDFKDRLVLFPFPQTEPAIEIADLSGEDMEVRCRDMQCYFVPLEPNGMCDWAFYDRPGGALTGINECRVVHCSQPNRAGQVGVRVWAQHHDYMDSGEKSWSDSHSVIENDTWRSVLISRSGQGHLKIEDPAPGVPQDPPFESVPMNLTIGTKWGGCCSGQVVGVCRVVIGGCAWKCLKVVHTGQHRKTKDGTPATYAEWYVAESGRTVLFRRFNGPGYAAADQLRSFESLQGELEAQVD